MATYRIMPDYRLITANNVSYPSDWEVDQERYEQAIALLKKTGYMIMPAVVAATGIVGYDNTYVLLHPQQLEMVLAYQYLSNNMTKEEHAAMPFGTAWCNMPAVVVNDTVLGGEDKFNLKGERDPQYEEAVLQYMDWDYGTEVE